MAKVKGQFVASSKKRKERSCVLCDEQEKKYILILISHKENGTHELSYKKRNYIYIYIYIYIYKKRIYYILKRQFCVKKDKSRKRTITTRTGVC